MSTRLDKIEATTDEVIAVALRLHTEVYGDDAPCRPEEVAALATAAAIIVSTHTEVS